MKIVIQKLTKKYRRKTVLNEINLDIGRGIFGLMGPNGSGKTTLIKIIVQLLKSTGGSVIYIKNDEVIKNFSKIKIGYLPQQFDVFEDFTVYEQLEYFSIMKGIKAKEINLQIKKVLELVNLENEINTKCKNLSGGMKRRIGIAQSFLGSPDLIILDEPTVGLDPYERIRFKEMIKKINLEIPIILSTHIIEDISSLCTDIILLKSGEILFSGSIDDFIKPKDIYVYETDIENIFKIKEENIHIRQDDVYRIITNQKLQYSFLEEKKALVDDVYLFMCTFIEKTNPM